MTAHNKTILVLITIVVACITFAVPFTIYADLVAPRRLPNGQLETGNIVNTWLAFVPLGLVYVFFVIWMIRGWQGLLRERRKDSSARPGIVAPAPADRVIEVPKRAAVDEGNMSDKWKNTWYLLRQWLLALPIVAIMLYALGARILIGDYLPVIVVVAATGALIAFIVYSANSRMRRLLQADSPQPLVHYFETSLGRSPGPNADVSRAFSKALAYTLYGQFAKAKLEMRSVDLTGRPPLMQAPGKFLDAQWAYLERHDYPGGLALAQEARRLCSVSSVFPGVGISLAAYDAIVAMGEVLSGNTQPNMLSELEKKLTKLPPLHKVIVAWALERAYLSLQRYAEAQKMRALINDMAPHCRALAKAP